MPVREWVCFGGCGKREQGLSMPVGWLSLSIRKSGVIDSGPVLLQEGPIDSLTGTYCSYDCVSMRAQRVQRTRRFSIHTEGAGGREIGLADL